MVLYCFACKNNSKTNPDVSYFRFPKDERCVLWFGILKQKRLPKHTSDYCFNSLRLCSNHFAEKDVTTNKQRKRLHPDALPIFSPGVEVQTMDNQKSINSNTEQKIRLKPFSKLQLGHSFTKNASTNETPLEEPEIKIKDIASSSLDDPLLITYDKKSKSLAKPKSNVAANQRPARVLPKESIMHQLKIASASQAEIIKKINLTPIQSTVDLTLDDDNDDELSNNQEKNNENVNLTATTLSSQNEIIFVDSEETSNNEKYKSDFICRICSKNKSVPYFHVPANHTALDIWKFCTGIYTLKHDDIVCATHFIKEDYLEVPPDGNSLGKLKPHVVPTPLDNIKLGCIIPSCSNKYKNSENMYSIPVWGYYTNWIQLLKGSIKYSKISELLQYRVCDRHFEYVIEENMFNLKPNKNISVENELQEYMAKKEKMSLEKTFVSVCAFLTCRREISNEGIKFPDDYKEAYYWLTLCNRADILIRSEQEIKEYLKNSHGLCPEHYNIIKTKAAASSMHLNKDNEKIVTIPHAVPEQIKIIPDEITYVPMREYCAFINCSSYIKTTEKKFRFPFSQGLLKKWQAASGIPDFINLNDFQGLFVCGKHFNEDQYTDRCTLQKDSVPKSYTTYNDENATNSNIHWTRKQVITNRKYIPKTTTKLLPQSFLKTTQQENNSNPLYLNVLQQPSTSAMQVPMIVLPFNAFSLMPPDVWPVGNNEKPSLLPENNLSDQLLNEKCCVKHCKSDGKTQTLYKFSALNPLMYELWIKAVENSPVIHPDKRAWYSTKNICSKHFLEEHRCTDTNLLRTYAVPTLDLVEENEIKIDPDTNIEWVKYEENSKERNEFLEKKEVRSKAKLRENSIEFPGFQRKLKFGVDCPKKGVNKFPYNIHRINNLFKPQQENVRVGHSLQMHTAIIIDDDDECEKNTLDMICDVVWRNQAPQKKKRTFKEAGL